VELLRQTVKVPLNVELAATQEMLRAALTAKPDQVTLVPERREEVTTEGGLDVALNGVQIKPVVRTLTDAGIGVAIFVDPVLEQVKAAHKVDALAIEINTAAYSEAPGREPRERELRRIVDAARIGRKLGLGVHAGHGLDYHNVVAIAALPEISELNIGHSIVSRAVLVGLERAVREMKAAMGTARGTD
jgi:pyridoxine 5-phosphate synthase